jgi:hypothetical protein
MVRLSASDTLAEVQADGYITAQSSQIESLNMGSFEWLIGDMVAVAASDGDSIFQFDGDDFSSLIPLPYVAASAPLNMKAVRAAAAAGGAAAQSFTDAFCTASSVVVGNWVVQANAASVLKIVPANGSFVVTSSADAGVGTFSYIITK